MVKVMIIGLGEHPRRVLKMLREYFKNNPNIIIYPEFFDDLRKLVSGNYRSYIRKLIKIRNIVKIAVWPDYLHRIPPPFTTLTHIIWIYPLHHMSELSFVLKLSDKFNLFLGFPNRDELRDYGLTRFITVAEEYSLKTWLLGLKPKFIKPKFIRHIRLFDGTDVTPISFPQLGLFKNFMNPSLIRKYVDLINSLLEKNP